MYEYSKLLDEETAMVLMKIAERSHMDNWFQLEAVENPSVENGDYYIVDLETEFAVEDKDFQEIISSFWGGMSVYEDYGLDAREISLFEDLLAKSGLKDDERFPAGRSLFASGSLKEQVADVEAHLHEEAQDENAGNTEKVRDSKDVSGR